MVDGFARNIKHTSEGIIGNWKKNGKHEISNQTENERT